ncbi:DNA-directed DNA polymerase [Zafaria cholistanensis]|uniref:DNA polymerase III subunit alpha n=1 Tax=Zafaria cholistanensis TaxID=1682741 RepID=A0A5A7NMT2_9MICC|nr:PHP domain-containing protein [Zafaria cholistanensis]GER22215.1 DNA-directed DNA polymerase [Zafaria cholistanensis]
MSFIHLNVASAFSAHYGVSWPKELVRRAAADGADALALTDRDGLYGAVKHLKACRDHGIDPILGVDLAVLGPARPGPSPRAGAEAGRLRTEGRVLVVARGHCAGAGYRALCRLVSAAHAHTVHAPAARAGGASAPGTLAVQGPRPSRHPGVTGADLAAHALPGLPGHATAPVLTVLLGPASDVGLAAARRDYARARAALSRWLELLGPAALRVELTTHLSRPGERLSTAHALRMLRTAESLHVPAILTNAVRYADPDGAATADVLDAARSLTSLEALADLQPNGQGWLKSTAQMEALAREIARDAANPRLAATLLRNTAGLADWARLDPAADTGWGSPKTPEAHVIGITGDPNTELAARCEAGITRLLPHQARDRTLRDRLALELDTIADLGFAPYFLTVAEVSTMITALGVRNAARGSGASSLVNHLLGISHVNPLAHGLVFERFLSRERTTLPDIDIDVESAQRHRVYRKIFERFGPDRTTLMSMQNGYRARGAVRDAGAALGMDTGDIDAIAKQLWRFPASSFRAALAEKPELRPLAQRLAATTDPHTRPGTPRQLDLLVDLTERLDRLPRHISMHPCGVILADKTLLDRTPVQPSGLGLPMSQYDKHDMDPMGLIKLDILGVRMQSAISHALAEVARIHGDGHTVASAGHHPLPADGTLPPYLAPNGTINLDKIPLDDEPTFELIRSTHTLGCFQIESPGQRELIGKLAPRTFNDLIIDISLFRPGPMKSNMVKPYLEHRHGFAPETYPHPDLRPALAETHGVTVFHEQVLRTLHTMTGCGLAKADVYRRLLGNPSAESRVEELFRTRARERGYPPRVIDQVWETLQAFGSFGFCKAHAAAFAVPTYQSAWLKAHHPEAFLAGLWEHDPGMYPKRLLVAEARRLGIPILPLDINRSHAAHRLEHAPAEGPGTGTTTGTAEGRGEGRAEGRAEGRTATGGTGPHLPQRPPTPRLGIRLGLAAVSGLSSTEIRRTIAGQPYGSLPDVRDRSGLTRTSLRHLAALGAFDELQHAATGTPGTGSHQGPTTLPPRPNRADLLKHLAAIPPRNLPAKYRPLPGQLPLPFHDAGIGDLELSTIHSTEPAPTPGEIVRTELDLTAMDTTAHLMDSHAPLLRQLGTTPAARLLDLRNGTEVLVAGIRIATQTPPMRGGRRVVFISLDDGTGCIDCAFFHEAQETAGPLLFGTRMLLIRGTTRRTGPRGISLQALHAWDLQDTASLPLPHPPATHPPRSPSPEGPRT